MAGVSGSHFGQLSKVLISRLATLAAASKCLGCGQQVQRLESVPKLVSDRHASLSQTKEQKDSNEMLLLLLSGSSLT